jgi:DNA modification methylase
MVADALREVGAARSIVIDEDDVILAGNGVTEAAAEAGITKVRVIEADGNEIIAVRRRGLTEAQKRALAIYDNRTAELASWNYDQLGADVLDGLSLQPFWTADEEAAMLAKDGPAQGRTDPDDVPAERATGIVAGDLFELGSHRLLCGDSTAAADVARLLGSVTPGLMITDPPYGISYDASWRQKAGINSNRKKLGKVTNDDRADWTDAWRLFPGDIAYVWHAGLNASIVQASLELAGFIPRAQIVWAKDRMALSRGDYHWQHEPCWYAVRDGSQGHRNDDRTQTTLWTIPARDDAGHGHSTQKPVECMRRPMQNHRIAQVYEPFSGSDTSLIAAEQSKQICFAIEIEPRYVQIAIDRWEAFTGQKAVKVGEAVRTP